MKYGMFIQTVVDFFIISFSIFVFVKVLNKLYWHNKKEEEIKDTAPTLTKEEELLMEIRDLLKQQRETR